MNCRGLATGIHNACKQAPSAVPLLNLEQESVFALLEVEVDLVLVTLNTSRDLLFKELYSVQPDLSSVVAAEEKLYALIDRGKQ